MKKYNKILLVITLIGFTLLSAGCEFNFLSDHKENKEEFRENQLTLTINPQPEATPEAEEVEEEL